MSKFIKSVNLHKIYEDNRLEEYEDKIHLVQLVPPEGRYFIWGIAQRIFGPSQEYATEACTLLERYLATDLINHTKKFGNSEWQKYENNLNKNIFMLILACFRLVSKLHTDGRISAQGIKLRIKKYLKSADLCIHQDLMDKAEIHVLETLDYRVALLSNRDKAVMLAYIVDIRSMEWVKLMMSIVDYNRNELQDVVHKVGEARRVPPRTPRSCRADKIMLTAEQNFNRIGRSARMFHKNALSYFSVMVKKFVETYRNTREPEEVYLRGRRKFWRSQHVDRPKPAKKILTMHLAAGAVAATLVILKKPDAISRLAAITDTEQDYLLSIRDAILNLLVHSPVTEKRYENRTRSKRPRV